MKKYIFSLLASLVALMPLQSYAEYPKKPVEFVVPFPPGDLEDILTRMIAKEFKKEYGVSAAVINKPGGGGGPFPGAVGVAQAPADGYTIGSFVSDVVLTGPKIGIPPLNPNPFEPIGVFVTYPFVIVAGENAPYNSIDELARYAQSNDVVLGHFGEGLSPTSVTLALAKAKGYEYASQAAFDALDCNTLASGDADVINTTLQLVLPCVDSIKVLASIGTKRIPILDNVPTVGEIVPDLNFGLWNGLFVKKDVPQNVREKIAKVAIKVMVSKEAKELASQTGALIYWQDAAEATEQIKADAITLEGIDALLQ